jgi:hypothetical protein
MPNIVSCPFCNSPVPIANLPAGESRMYCPRCEETIPIDVTRIEALSNTAIPATPTPPAARVLTNRAVAGLVVAVMLGMAGLGLTFALKTIGVRRANDSKGVQPPEPAADSRPLPPAEWPGLGYLPGDVHAVAGIRVADALDTAAGRALLEQLGLADVKKTTILGISPVNVDYLMFGASLRTLPPRVTAVVRGSIADAFASGRLVDHHGKTLHRTKLWATGPEGVIWRADRQTLIAALLPEDLDRVTAKPQAAPLPELMERLDPAAMAWLVAKLDATNPAFGFAMPYLPPAEHDARTKLEALAVSIRPDGSKLTLTVQLRGKDAASGEVLAKAAADSLTKIGVTAERKLDGNWQNVTATAEAENLAGWLRPR